MRTQTPFPRKRESAIYALAVDSHNVHCMTESLIDTWWASLDPEDKADLYSMHLAGKHEVPVMTPNLFETAEDRAVRSVYDLLRGEPLPPLTTRQRELLRVLVNRRGAARAVPIADLARTLQATPRDIKGDVRDLRLLHGIRIGSSRGQETGGYYLITSTAELMATVTPMLHQLRAEAAVVRAMCEPHELAELEGQLRLSEPKPTEAA